MTIKRPLKIIFWTVSLKEEMLSFYCVFMSLCLPQQKKKKTPQKFAHVYLVSSATLNVNLVDAIFIKHYILFI